jgi:hypothetical protein
MLKKDFFKNVINFEILLISHVRITKYKNVATTNSLFFNFEQLLHSTNFAYCCVEARKCVAESGSVFWQGATIKTNNAYLAGVAGPHIQNVREYHSAGQLNKGLQNIQATCWSSLHANARTQTTGNLLMQ